MLVQVLGSLSTAGTGPTADAGPDQQVVSGAPVTLDGTGSFGSGAGPLTYQWSQTSGPAVSLSGTASATATFVAPTVSSGSVDLLFRLTVTEDGLSAEADTMVTVAAPPPPSGGGGGGGGTTGGGTGGTGGGTTTDDCPNDPAKTDPGVCGCGVPDADTDSDGTPDCHDGCPADPAKLSAGACGCGTADTDTDSDGTPNCLDACPNDPAKTNPGVCGCGVSDADSDSDGVADCNDNCVNTTDSDGDGVGDCTDGCPNDPNKTAPGTCGCGVADTNSDGDSRPNCTDGCPNDPNKIAPGICGCGVADTNSDGDSRPNCTDGCPNDPNKIAPGICGCGVADTDGDGDGVPDCNDGCPTDPNKTAPGACGCGVPDTNSDGDSRPNCTDGCPNDPNKIAPGACGCGVPDTDGDGDGVPNCNDGCPNDRNKTAPGVCGCGVPDTNTDGDSRPDCTDGCPTDPAKIAPGLCGCGNPDLDSDNDTVCNNVDRCPGFDDRIDTNANGTPDGCESAALCLGTTSLSFGQTTTQLTFQAWNCGVGTLAYSVADNAAWLTVSPTSGSSTGEHDTLTATVDRTGLAGNTYQGTITVTPSVGAAIQIIVSMSVAQAGTSPPVINLVASRTSGVSPLGVFFDATATTSSRTSAPFHELDFTWDFGDPGSGFTNRPGVDANRAKGGVAAHVFELPPGTCSGGGGSCVSDGDCPTGATCNQQSKTYTVTLTVKDATGANSQVQQAIQVTPFTGTTYYVSDSAGSDTNTGTSPSAAFKSWTKGIQMVFLSNGPRRVLFKRDETFPAPTAFAGSTSFGNKNGPYVIGAYGSGNRPIIDSTHTSLTLELKSSTIDTRIVDLDFHGPFPGVTPGTALATGSKSLLLRARITGHSYGVSHSGSQKDDTLFVDSSFVDNSEYAIFYNYGKNIAVLACEMDHPNNTESLLRVYTSKTVVSANIFKRNVQRGHQLKYCGRVSPDRAAYIVISDNQFLGGDFDASASIGPQNRSSRENVGDVVVERNTWDMRGVVNKVAIQSRGANDVTIRNNLFLECHTGLSLGSHVIGFSTWDRWRVYNNSFSKTQGGTIYFLRAYDSTDPVVFHNFDLRNNIVSVPGDSGGVIRPIEAPAVSLGDLNEGYNIWYFPHQSLSQLFDIGGTSFTLATFGTLTRGSRTADPLFLTPGSDLRLQISGTPSPAINAGTSVPGVMEDFLNASRPRGSSLDIGAYEAN
ncbi:MAG: thrombospondin type 3 repeat-containing protein [Planctomycetes bacterium]|nr:thrombospondin type 3 repeat-containing protein [Planctomycetota bacterium]